ncbi:MULTISPECIES: tRNA (cytidine(34)-2'-O)-methyltransferase [Terrabacteria group]|uniref:tRNA (cytidine(34)-2'-O)-methyltransferase n=1 Tax=Bacillati TaxID=1783272 RepID=UPI00193A4DDD|nr:MULTISPECIES: tRNA (cytidine(34)-2'-O)-methyltransferase [Terrabacteria group]MBW9211858.1 tRNA (cytidine(34)-2'-O)-methyltransferase [Trueperella sp. zg.1013]QRG87338.1 tRNA (cytidine(34)-2'-O)-methyltransferase [Bulleidia sp. zg-1006]
MIYIVLFEPEIPGNTGNIMRTCAAWNMKLCLIEPLGFRLDEKHLKRAGMDYSENVDYVKYMNWDAFLKEHEGKGLFYYVTRYGKRTPDSFLYPKEQDIYLIFGKESTGIPKEILASHEEYCIRIPMVQEARSLNLSNCVALCAYEVNRQLGYPGLSHTEVIKGPDFLNQFK